MQSFNTKVKINYSSLNNKYYVLKMDGDGFNQVGRMYSERGLFGRIESMLTHEGFEIYNILFSNSIPELTRLKIDRITSKYHLKQ